MIFDNIDGLPGILKINSLNDYPQIEELLAPAAESVIAESVGPEWVKNNENDPAVKQLMCALIASWFEKPEAFGELNAGCNFLISQLQARALEVQA